MSQLLNNWQRRVMVIAIGILLFQVVYLIDQKVLDPGLTSFLKWFVVLTAIGEFVMSYPTIINRAVIQIPFWIINFFATVVYTPSVEGIQQKSVLFYLDLIQNMGNADSAFLHINTLWYGIALMIVFWLLSSLLNSKTRILVISLIFILSFAILDSYTRLNLDRELSMIVFSCLVLVMMQHYSKLMEEQERIWQFLSNNPTRVLLSLVVISVLIFAADRFTWETEPLLPDPYTMWQDFKNKVNGTGGGGAGAGAGGNKTPQEATANYGFEEYKLGDGFNFDATPILQVKTSYKQYLRGQTKSVYNGKGWESSNKEKNTTMAKLTPDVTLGPYDWVNVKSVKAVDDTQVVTLVEDLQYPVYFGAYPIKKVLDADNSAEKVERVATWSQYNEEVRFNVKGNIAYPKSYTILSQPPIIDEDLLKKVTPEFLDFEKVKSNKWLKDYLVVPDTLPDRVKKKAEEVTKGKTSIYEKSKAIEQYLYTNFKYNNHPDVKKAISKDFVDSFLFEIKEGYCDYYSTAMVMMARSIGIPARWVQGYTEGMGTNSQAAGAPGAAGATTSNASAGEEDTYTIRNSDSHSWAEIFFEGYGWVSFEPTAGFVMPQLSTAKKVEAKQQLAVNTQTTKQDQESKVWKEIKQILFYTFMTILFGGGAVFFWKRRAILFFLKVFFKSRNLKTVNQKVIFEFEKLLYYASMSGFYHTNTETIREITREWISQKSYLKQDMDILMSLFERACYSTDNLMAEDLNLAAQTVDKFRKGI